MRISLTLVLGLALCLPAFKAFAQPKPQPNIDQETRNPARAQQTQAQAASSAEEASRLEAAEADMSITYDQVLANPDDIELNYRYARAQIARGELKSAGAALERILIIKPELAKVRLLYAVVLLRLDNLAEAERELKILQALPMPDSLRAEIEKYLALIQNATKLNHLSGTVGMGMENDDNRNATPASGRMLFLNVPVALTGASGTRHDDASLLWLASVNYERDLGFQAGHTLFANYSYYRAEQASVKSLNLQAHSLAGGGTYKSRWMNVTPRALFDHILLAQTTFLREWGFGMRFERAMDRQLNLYMDFKDLNQVYQVTAGVPTGPERDGADMIFTWGGDYVLTPKMKLGAGTAYEIKNANKEYNSFTRNTLFARHDWLLPKGTFLGSSFAYNRDVYDQPQIALSRLYRRDDWFRISATGGLPMGLVHPVLKDLLTTLTYEYFHSFSTLQNYAYTNNKIVGMMTYRWGVAF